jgi:hypothetical protein
LVIFKKTCPLRQVFLPETSHAIHSQSKPPQTIQNIAKMLQPIQITLQAGAQQKIPLFNKKN